ncbi:hypothetical protein PR048_009599 [Dryococelus australis]|uniref:Integrase catalytic domain-containing protein n=1 Tax=Dryococelus australis TaxID=614101 RepID=A0ABQ9I0R2_9NEOP|nr:hypothetical protein PR048_009599 [Dryococelus australis]
MSVGCSKVYETICRLVYWSGMQRDETKVDELKAIVPKRPLEIVSVDLFGPLRKDQTHFCCYAIVNATAVGLLGKMKLFVEEVGKPEVVLSDKGTQFTSEVWQQGMLKFSIVPTTVAVRHPLIELVMNHKGHVSTSLSPHMSTFRTAEIYVYTYLNYLKCLMKLELGLFALVKTNHISQFWENVTCTLFNMYQGSYKIFERVQNNCYGVRDQVTKEVIGCFNINAMRRYHGPVVEAEQLCSGGHLSRDIDDTTPPQLVVEVRVPPQESRVDLSGFPSSGQLAPTGHFNLSWLLWSDVAGVDDVTALVQVGMRHNVDFWFTSTHKPDIPENICQPAASSGMIPRCENLGTTLQLSETEDKLILVHSAEA